jgi:hypothetical protein
VSTDHKNNESPFSPRGNEDKPDTAVTLKTWHRPVISRIEIAQTLCAAGMHTDSCGAHS